MLNHDFYFDLKSLNERVNLLEEVVRRLSSEKPSTSDDWDNATLMQQWQISERTAARYRKAGLDSYKVGGRLYYTADQRNQFVLSGEQQPVNSDISGKEVCHG